MFLVNVFLSVCHAIIEDTALFLAVGANPLVIIVGRLMLAVIITFMMSRYFDRFVAKKASGLEKGVL